MKLVVMLYKNITYILRRNIYRNCLPYENALNTGSQTYTFVCVTDASIHKPTRTHLYGKCGQHRKITQQPQIIN